MPVLQQNRLSPRAFRVCSSSATGTGYARIDGDSPSSTPEVGFHPQDRTPTEVSSRSAAEGSAVVLAWAFKNSRITTNSDIAHRPQQTPRPVLLNAVKDLQLFLPLLLQTSELAVIRPLPLSLLTKRFFYPRSL